MTPDQCDTPDRGHAPPRRLTIAWAATLGVLLLATLNLWLPGRVAPRVAPAEWLEAAPRGVDFLGLALVAWGLLTSLTSRKPRRSIGIALAGLVLLASVDQLRWQAWAYHALIVGAVLGAARRSLAIRALRWLAIGVYAWSAVAKLDVVFADTLGPQMLEVLSAPLGLGIDQWSPGGRRAAALALPIAELSIAALLAVSLWAPRLRWPAISLAVCQHLITIVVLGPWGLDHGIGVLLWNVGFAAQTVLAFSMDAQGEASAGSRTLGDRIAIGIVGVVLATPIAYSVGYGDAWLNWALYAPRGERSAVFVRQDATRRLPPTLERQLGETDGEWRRVRVDRWVLAETGAPLYPATRVKAALTAIVMRRCAINEGVQLIAEAPADRLSGERSSRTLVGVGAISDDSARSLPPD